MHISKVHGQHFLVSSQGLGGSLKTRKGGVSRGHMSTSSEEEMEGSPVKQGTTVCTYHSIIHIYTFLFNHFRKKMSRKSYGAKFQNQVVISMSEIDIDHRLVLFRFLLYLQKPSLPVPSRILKKKKNTPKELSFKCIATTIR